MKFTREASWAAAFLALCAASPLSAQEPDLETPEARAGYSIGLRIGREIVRDLPDIDVAALLMGISDSVEGDSKLSEEEAMLAIQEYTQAQQSQEQAEQDAAAQAGRDFLAQNGQNPAVTTTDSGLQYEILEESSDANAPMPGAADTVTVHYHGTLVDGTVFDSSVERGEPATFPLNGVIPGWTEGLQLMRIGDSFRFFIPPELAYGSTGAGGSIGPNATLIFDVELLGIE